MNLLSLLYRISAWQLAAAVLASVLSGIAELGTTICVLESFRRGALLWWQFAIVAALALITGRYSRYVVSKLASKSSARMRRRLVRAVLQLPLLSLEDLGPTRLLIAFTGELSSVATAVRNLASLSTNGAILLACLAYIGWLSLREMFIVAALCLICIVGAFLLRALEKRHRHAAGSKGCLKRRCLDRRSRRKKTACQSAQKLQTAPRPYPLWSASAPEAASLRPSSVGNSRG